MTMPQQRPGTSRQDYQTPPEFLDAVLKRLHIDKFDWDLAASRENSVAEAFFSENPYTDALLSDWSTLCKGWMWLNPPYSNIAPWVEKAANESKQGAQIAMLVPASMGSNWYRDWVQTYAYQCVLNGRLTFVGQTAPYPKDCALLLYHPWGFIGQEIWSWKN